MAIGPYTGTVRSITPVLTDDNWILSGGAGEVAVVMRAGAGGEPTTTTAMCTRWNAAVIDASPGALTAGNVGKGTPNLPTNTVSFGTTFATNQPALAAGDLWAESWNAHGGIVRWEARDETDAWVLIGAATEKLIVCRNSVGVGLSTYGVTWEEF